jgi:hypothetical protein
LTNVFIFPFEQMSLRTTELKWHTADSPETLRLIWF